MAVELATAYLNLVPSAKGIQGALGKELHAPLVKAGGDAGDAASKSFGSRFKGGLKIAGIASAAAFGAGFFKVLKTGFDESKDASAGIAQLNAGIKSTGNVAHVSTKGLTDLAGSIQGFSGQTDDSIVASEQLLLTFTNIRNEAGKGNDIFNQATLATANLAAKMGGDASASAIQLGKALNDPTKGITALTRVGVSFTDAQKKQIKELQASGNIMGAQKIILGELNKEFGGAAKAAGESLPGSLARMRRSFEDVAQSIFDNVAPALTAGAGGMADLLERIAPEAGRIAGSAIGTLGSVVQTAMGAANTAITAFTTVVGPAWSTFWGGLPQVGQGALEALNGIVTGTLGAVRGTVQFISALIVGDWSGAWAAMQGTLRSTIGRIGAIGSGLSSAFGPIASAIDQLVLKIASLFPGGDNAVRLIQEIGTQAQAHSGEILTAAAALTTFAGAILAINKAQGVIQVVGGLSQVIPELLTPLLAAGPVGLVIAAIVALAAGFAVAFVKIRPFHDAVVGIGQAIVGFGRAAAEWITGTALPAIEGFLSGTIGKISAFGSTLFSLVSTAFAPLLGWINTNVIPTFQAIGDFFAAVGQLLGQIVSAYWTPAFQIIKFAVTTTFDAVKATVQPVLDVVRGAFQAFIAVIGPAWSIAWLGIKTTVVVIFDAIKGTVEAVLGVIRGIFQFFTGLISGDWSKTWEGIKTLFSSTFGKTVGIANQIVDQIVGAVGQLPGKLLSLGGALFRAGGAISMSIINGITDAFLGAGRVAGDLADSLVAFVRNAWNSFAQKLNDLLPNDISVHGVKLFDLPDNPIPSFANGAVVSTPTLAVVGDAGTNNPEVVAPRSEIRSILRSELGTPRSNGGATIYATMPGLTADDFYKGMKRLIDEYGQGTVQALVGVGG